jgi:hypothetical protein
VPGAAGGAGGGGAGAGGGVGAEEDAEGFEHVRWRNTRRVDVRIFKGDRTISSLKDWETHAGPKRGMQWKAGRSAMELARAWFPIDGSPTVPTELAMLLASRPEFAGIQLVEGCPEMQVPLDELPGETRNADLVLLGQGGGGAVAISVEAKADEPFGDLIGQVLARAEATAARGERTNTAARVEGLVEALFGDRTDALPWAKELRYQLLHGIAAALIHAKAKRADAALFLVHEFRGEGFDMRKAERNSADLETFVRRLPGGGAPEDIGTGKVVGPFRVPGGGKVPGGIPLYVGKVVRELS